MPMDLEELDERTLASIARYDEHAREYQEALRRHRPRADIRRFAAFAERGDLVLDGACGPASDLRLLRDAGLHPVGVDLSMGALAEAHMLLPRHPKIRAPLQDLPFKPKSFQGLWLSGAFTHLPRDDWQNTFSRLMGLLERGPVYFSCYLGDVDLQPFDDEILGKVYISAATPEEVGSMLAIHKLDDLTIEVRPDPLHGKTRPWVVALGHL